MKNIRILILCSLLLVPTFAISQDTPKVKVTNVRRVFHNGEHNAFTDLIRWKGKFWLTFRSCPDGHMVHPTSKVIVLSSSDTKEWKEEYNFSVPKRDVRDPHFLIFKEKLFIYAGTWFSGDGPLPRDEYDLNRHLGYAVWSEDGETWNDPRQLEGTYGHYIWKAATYDGKAYLCGRRKKAYSSGVGETKIVQSALLESDDGLIWRFKSLFQENRGDETAFLFEEDGSLLAVSRTSGGEPAQLVRSKTPFSEWTRKDFPFYIGGPHLAKWGDRYFVGGRRNSKKGPKTGLFWLVGDELKSFAILPSGGDNSYPGFVALDDKHGVVSWYSSHEKDDEGKTITAIYMADLEIEE